MKKVRQLAHHFFYNIAFVKKMIFLFCIGILVPMIFQQTVYYLETERGIKERMLSTVNEALDDKTLKIDIQQTRRCISVWIKSIQRISTI